MAKRGTWTAFCDRCYSWHREGLGKREAAREATGHMAMFPGHAAHVVDTNKGDK